VDIIVKFLYEQGFTIRSTSRSGMGTALLQFPNSLSLELAFTGSPYFIGDSVVRIVPHNRGLNYTDCTFTHDVWIMMMNFPLEGWIVEKIHESVSSFGRFLVTRD
jgi:ABC-type uncharacterized transport system permease subunit